MTATREQLLHLADRARRGALLPDEGALLADAVAELYRQLDVLDHVAAGNKRHVQLIVPELRQAEAAIERVRALHQPAPGGSGGLSFNSGARCAACDHPYRCDTIRTLDQAQQPTT